MKKKLLFFFFLSSRLLFCQNEEITNTYVNTFNTYFYPFGSNPTNQNSQSYNPHLQFSLFYPPGINGCLPINNDNNPYNDSRFNIINYDFPQVNGWSPDLYCNKGIENGPGINNSGSVRVSIRGIDDNAGGIPNDGSDDRSRVEFVYYPKHYKEGVGYTSDVLNEIYYYRWNFFIPNDSTFPDMVVDYDGNGSRDSFHIISQFHQPDWVEKFDPVTGIRISDMSEKLNLIEGDQPPIFINYLHEPDAPDNKRDIVFLYGYRNSNDSIQTGSTLDRSSNFRLVDGINKGEWNTIILKIKWSPLDEVGYMKAWVNDETVFGNPNETQNEISNPNYQTTTPEIIKGANMVLSQEGNAISNFMQMGHYRKYLDTEATIIFDDLIITQNEEFAFNGFKTKLEESYCGTTLDSSYIIKAKKLPKIDEYKFKFEVVGNSNQVIEISQNNNSYNLNDNSFFQPNKQYKVYVAVKVKGESTFRSYNEDYCIVTTPYLTNLISDYCGGTLDITDMHLTCKEILNATNYKFRFTTENNQTFWIDSPTPTIYIRSNPNFYINKKYFVQVRAQGDHFDYAYGEGCNFRIPQYTRLMYKYCNSIIGTGDILECYKIPNEENYKFRFENEDGNLTWIDSNSGLIQLPYSSFFSTGEILNVDVRASGGYDESCDIFINNQGGIYYKNSSEDFQTDIQIYPNPITRAYFNIDAYFTEKPVNLNLYLMDVNGRVVQKFNLPKNKTQLKERLMINKNVRTGIYFLMIESENSKTIKKIIIH